MSMEVCFPLVVVKEISLINFQASLVLFSASRAAPYSYWLLFLIDF